MFKNFFHHISKIRSSIVTNTRRGFFQACESSSSWNKNTSPSQGSERRISVVSRNTNRKMTSKTTQSESPPISNSTKSPMHVEENIDQVLSNLFSFCCFVKLDRLTAEEKLIHSKHLKALQNHQEMYEDPSTGYSVLTRLAHLRRGQCCGNACRHCPYGQKNVPVDHPRKTYNTAFFV